MNLGQMVVIGIVVLGALANLFSIVDRRKVQDRRISMATEYATREALEEVRADVEVVDGKVEALKGEIVRNGETRRMAIEAKVEVVDRKVEEGKKEARECADDLRREIGQTRDEVKELVGETRIINQNFAQLSMEVRNRSREMGI